MPAPTSRLAYPDVESFFDAALADDIGARLPFRSKGEAIQFRVRANNFRSICRADNARIYRDPAEPLHGRSVYDALQLTILGPDANNEYWVYARRVETIIAEVEPLSTLEDEHGS
jgi:hypothetical protein